MTDKYKKYKKIVNTPQEWLKDKFDNIKDWSPDNNWWQLLRVPSATIAFNLYFLALLITKLGLENPLIERIEDNNSKKEINNNSDSFFKRAVNAIKRQKKKSPTASAFIAYYMMWLVLIGGGKITYSNQDKTKEFVKEWRIKLGHYDNEIEKFKLDPTLDNDAWHQQVEAVHPYVIAHIFSSEGVILDVYDDNGGRGTPTVGAGFILSDDIHIKFAERILQRPVSASNFHLTKSEARLVSDAWLREKIYPGIKKQFKTSIDSKLFVSLAVAAYNKGHNIYNDGNSGQIVRDAVNKKLTNEEILHAYIKAFGATKKTQWSGLANKYAVCAMYYSGNVQDSVILKAIAEAPYALDAYVKEYQKDTIIPGSVPGRLLTYGNDGRANGLIVPENIDEMLLKTKYRKTQGTIQEPVMNYLSEDEVYRIMHGHLFDVQSDLIIHLKSDDAVKDIKVDKNKVFELMYNKALDLYKQNKYEQAAVAYEQLIALYPDNALLHNDLSATYNKLGRYDDAILQAQEVVRRIGDKSQYGAAQYNAGYAYEQKGDLKKALQNYKLALSNGNNAAKTAYKRVKGNIAKQKSKTTAFNDGILKIKEKQNYQIDTIDFIKDNEYTA